MQIIMRGDFNPFTQFLNISGCLMLFGPGGRILPTASLDVNNFFNIKVNATKLRDFL